MAKACSGDIRTSLFHYLTEWQMHKPTMYRLKIALWDLAMWIKCRRSCHPWSCLLSVIFVFYTQLWGFESPSLGKGSRLWGSWWSPWEREIDFGWGESPRVMEGGMPKVWTHNSQVRTYTSYHSCKRLSSLSMNFNERTGSSKASTRRGSLLLLKWKALYN